ncbi:folate family ECF transporter S component [uncultured Dysosmobacter sp.]|uniref:folate family ECF transporter S component n=1 Tax=uncultured Dysosmobacter sp. TaxID=2591384 RepID=UPI002604DA8B|nr:folate family ECF transporter S component [uncultured Dysosmobacter sp.]
MSKFNTRTTCTIAVLAAMYVPLSLFLSVQGPNNLKFSFGSLPVVVAALLMGPVEAALTAFIGEFLKQLLSYGFTATTLLWTIPTMLRGLVIGAAAIRFKRTAKPLTARPILCNIVCIAAAVITTAANTLVIWLDSVIYGYYSFAYVFGATAARFVTGMITSVLVALVAVPLVYLLERQKLFRT